MEHERRTWHELHGVKFYYSLKNPGGLLAANDGKITPASRVVAMDIKRDNGKKGKNFALFNNILDEMRWYYSLPVEERIFYEYVGGTRPEKGAVLNVPQKFRLDLEIKSKIDVKKRDGSKETILWPDELNPGEFLQQLTELCVYELKRIFASDNQKKKLELNLEHDFCLADSSIDLGKRSFVKASKHIVIDGYSLSSNAECKFVYDRLMQSISIRTFLEQVPEAYRSGIIDFSVYASRQQFRLLYATKIGEQRYKMPQHEWSYRGDIIRWSPRDADLDAPHFRTYEAFSLAFVDACQPWVVDMTNLTTNGNKREAPLPADLDIPGTDVNVAFEMLGEDKHHFKITGVTPDRHGFLVGLQRLSPEPICRACNRQHGGNGEGNDNAWMVIGRHGTQTVNFYCHRGIELDEKGLPVMGANGKAKYKRALLGRLHPERYRGDDGITYEVYKAPIPTEEGFGSDANPWVPELFLGPIDNLAIKSHMGSGKTQKLILFVIRTRPARTLMPSCRQLYANAMTGEYNTEIKKDNKLVAGPCEEFKCYLEAKTTDAKLALSQSNHLVLQLESFHWLTYGFVPYDLILFDEAESILKQFSSPTMCDEKTRLRVERFQEAIEQAKQVIVGDAFLSQRTIEVLEMIRGKFRVIHNRARPPKKKAVEYWGKPAWNQALKETVLADKNVFIFFGSQKELVEFEKWVQSVGRSHTMVSYHREGDETKRPMLANVNEEWVKYKIVATTSTITVGVNFSPPTPHFDELFVLSSRNGCCVRDVFQASYRVRKIKSNTMHYVLVLEPSPASEKNRVSESLTLEGVQRDLLDLVNRQNEFTEACAKRGFFPTFSKFPDWYVRCWAYNVLEDNLSYYKHTQVFNAYLKECNYEKDSVTSIGGVKFAPVDPRKRTEIPIITNPGDMAQINHNIRTNTATVMDHWMLRRDKFEHRVNQTPETTTEDRDNIWLKYIAKGGDAGFEALDLMANFNAGLSADEVFARRVTQVGGIHTAVGNAPTEYGIIKHLTTGLEGLVKSGGKIPLSWFDSMAKFTGENYLRQMESHFKHITNSNLLPTERIYEIVKEAVKSIGFKEGAMEKTYGRERGTRKQYWDGVKLKPNEILPHILPYGHMRQNPADVNLTIKGLTLHIVEPTPTEIDGIIFGRQAEAYITGVVTQHLPFKLPEATIGEVNGILAFIHNHNQRKALAPPSGALRKTWLRREYEQMDAAKAQVLDICDHVGYVPNTALRAQLEYVREPGV